MVLSWLPARCGLALAMGVAQVFRITTYRKARSAPTVRTDEDCIWGSDEYLPDEDGFDCADYVPQGSVDLSPWEEMVMRLVR